MSYLPRMSKTYKEPQQRQYEESEENLLPNTRKPASSLLNEKGYTPQSILKHYRYHPHPPPVLPGPSLLEEALENERFIEANRLRRTVSKMEDIAETSNMVEDSPPEEEQQDTAVESESTSLKLKRPKSRKNLKKSKSSLGKKKSSKLLKRENSSKIINMCYINPDIPFAFNKNATNSKNVTGDFETLRPNEKSLATHLSTNKHSKPKKIIDLEKQDEVKEKKTEDRSTQCVIVGSFSREFVIPPVISTLLQTLLFLFHETNRDTSSKFPITKEKKTLLTQIQSLLDNLCNEKVDKEYSFEMTYSDFKRLEKIHGEIKKYLIDVYGDKNDCIDKMEDLKRIFIELRTKEMELFDMGEKLVEMNEALRDVVLSEKDLKNPEVAIQNNRLESEQLMAEVEFGLMELRNYQKSIAELDWDIKGLHKKAHILKKSISSTKTEVLRKSSKKFLSESLSKGNKTLSESSSKINI